MLTCDGLFHSHACPQIKERPNAINLRELNKSVRFEGVSFDYAACEKEFTVLPKRSMYVT